MVVNATTVMQVIPAHAKADLLHSADDRVRDR